MADIHAAHFVTGYFFLPGLRDFLALVPDVGACVVILARLLRVSFLWGRLRGCKAPAGFESGLKEPLVSLPSRVRAMHPGQTRPVRYTCRITRSALMSESRWSCVCSLALAARFVPVWPRSIAEELSVTGATITLIATNSVRLPVLSNCSTLR